MLYTGSNSLSVDGRPLKIAVFFGASGFNQSAGGAGTYELSILEIVRSLGAHHSIDFQLYVPSRQLRFAQKNPQIPDLPVKPYRLTILEKLTISNPYGLIARLVAKFGLFRTRRKLLQTGIDAVYFTSPNGVALVLEDIPFIATFWDLGHRDLPGFPEVWSQSLWVRRETENSVTVPRASFVMVDSQATGKKLEKHYGLDSRRWSAIGLLPPTAATTGTKREIEDPYVIYPAMRWAHKNHKTLIRAFASVILQYPKLRLVLTGADKGSGESISNLINTLGLSESVIDLGYIPNERLTDLIRNAEMLVMPTLLGPTNLPPLEALAVGTRIIISSAHSFGPEIPSGVVKVEPLDVLGWATAIKEVLQSPRTAPCLLNREAEVLQIHASAFELLAKELECL